MKISVALQAGFCILSMLYLFVVDFKVGCAFGCKIHWVNGSLRMCSLTPSCGVTGDIVVAALLVLLQVPAVQVGPQARRHLFSISTCVCA